MKSFRSKGSQFEYSVFDSLKPIYPNILLTKQLGFVQQYDLVDHTQKFVIECKRHKAFSWNEMREWFNKLESKAPEGYSALLIVKGNRQPPLVMFTKGISHKEFKTHGPLLMEEFRYFFGVEFLDRQNKKPLVESSKVDTQ